CDWSSDVCSSDLCRLREARRAVAVRRLRQAGKESGLAEGQFVEGFVEIGECRSGNTVGARAEIDLVQVQFEDALLRQRRLDAGCQENLLDLAFDRNLARQQ